MASSHTGRLVRLGDSDLMVASPAEDVRGRDVVDRYGEEIGKVDELFIDEEERRVRFLEVQSGGFLGIGGQSRLVPVDAVVAIDDDAVHVSETRQRVHDAPAYDPELTSEWDYWDDLYGYYGKPPHWGAGYMYPPYPF